MSELESIVATVEKLLVETFGFPEAEARHRLNLWRLQQHSLEGQSLEAVLPGLSSEKQAEELLRWALQGELLSLDLSASSDELGVDLNGP